MESSSELARAALDPSQAATKTQTPNETTQTPITSSSLKRTRKMNYQKLTPDEDLTLIRLCVEWKSLFKHGSKTLFWNKMQAELSKTFDKTFSSVDRHVTGMVRKHRAGRLKMPQEYIKCLEKWYQWQEKHCTANGYDEQDEPSRGDSGEEEIDERAVAPDMAPSARKRQKRAIGNGEHRLHNGQRAVERHSVAAETRVVAEGIHRAADKTTIPRLPNGNAKTNGHAPTGGKPVADAAGNGVDGDPDGGEWPDSSVSGDDPIGDQLYQAVEMLMGQAKKAPSPPLNTALLMALTGLVRDNRSRIFDLDDDIRKEQKKRKWNDDIVWSMVKNKCAELDLEYNEKLRQGHHPKAGLELDLMESALIQDMRQRLERVEPWMDSTSVGVKQMSENLTRSESMMEKALKAAEAMTQREQQWKHPTGPVSPALLKGSAASGTRSHDSKLAINNNNYNYENNNKSTSPTNGEKSNQPHPDSEPATTTTAYNALREQVKLLLERRDSDTERISRQESMILRMDRRLHELEGRLAKGVSTKG